MANAVSEILNGEHYHLTLTRLHSFLAPKRYLEVGTYAGESLRFANCASISIDPKFNISTNVIGEKPICHFYQMTSDEFFRDEKPSLILGGKLDFVFLDGLHVFEFLLRDFMNSEPYCTKKSVIALHDCMPTHQGMVLRDFYAPRNFGGNPQPGWWTGDVWKILLILKKYRPDLRVIPLSAAPTGLVLITGLDPKNSVIRQNYDAIVAEFMEMDLEKIGVENFLNSIEVSSPQSMLTKEAMAARLWG